MRPRAMSLVVCLSLLLGLSGMLPGVAMGARAERYHDEETILVCDPLELSDGSTAFLLLDASEHFGDLANLLVWAEGTIPFDDAPSIVSDAFTITVAPDLSGITASVDILALDASVEPPVLDFLGVAEVDASLTPAGEPEPFSDEFKEGNRRFSASGTRQVFAVEGTLTLPDGTTGDLATCFSGHVSVDVFSNNPARDSASVIFRSAGLTMSCQWETDLGTVLLFADSGEFGSFSDLLVLAENSFAFGSAEDPVFTTTEFSASYDIFLQEEEGETLIGTATAEASITPTRQRAHFTDGGTKLIGQVLSVDGSLELALDGGLSLAMDDQSCQAFDARRTEHFVDPRGPKPKPLVNDTPAGALPLGIGDSDTVITGANAFEPEAPCTGEDPESGDPFDFPITFTAWWTFSGTGGDVTVSTAGSDFDTILGVYQLVGEDLVQVACVDDVVDSFQAVVTVTTEADATYYIQAGGFDGSIGHLVVSLE